MDWCTPSTLSPSSWVPGFSDEKKTYYCAISGGQDGLEDILNQHCCKGAVQKSDDGCFMWCAPKMAKSTDWAMCVSDHVYVDRISFGTSCNNLGELEVSNAVDHHREIPVGPKPSAGNALSASWKLGVLVGALGLIQAVW